MASHAQDSDYDDDRSSDDESQGSMVDFIVNDEELEESGSSEVEDNEINEAQQLREAFPYDPSYLEEAKNDGGGLRRSRRQKKAVTRYVDDRFAELFTKGEDMSEINAVLEEDGDNNDDNAPVNTDDEDGDYQEPGSESDNDSDDDSDDDDDNEEDTSDFFFDKANPGGNQAQAVNKKDEKAVGGGQVTGKRKRVKR